MVKDIFEYYRFKFSTWLEDITNFNTRVKYENYVNRNLGLTSNSQPLTYDEFKVLLKSHKLLKTLKKKAKKMPPVKEKKYELTDEDKIAIHDFAKMYILNNQK